MPKDTVARYLTRHAEPLVQDAPDLIAPVKHVICIPACDEDERFGETLDSIVMLDGDDPTLLILLINGAEDAPDSVHIQNAKLLSWARALLHTPNESIGLATYKGLQVALVDCATPGRRLPAKQGVGLARKLAGDLALHWHRKGQISSTWMACTDADVCLPTDYLTALPSNQANYSAVLFPFEHTLEGSPAQQTAMQQYECYLHYYVLGLQQAQSPYAYHSIGSSFAVHMERYAAVHGFPKKLAAEDFYLLNKLIKQAPFLRLNCAPIRIRGRESMRVPFGTGRAVRDIQAETSPYSVYHPLVFEAVRTWQHAQAAFVANPQSIDWEQHLSNPALPAGILYDCLKRQGAFTAAENAKKQTSSTTQLRRRLFEWNDAFRTLRLIHELRDSGLPSLPLIEAINRAPFAANAETLDQARQTLTTSATPNSPTEVGVLEKYESPPYDE